jgi:hypothetical protein
MPIDIWNPGANDYDTFGNWSRGQYPALTALHLFGASSVVDLQIDTANESTPPLSGRRHPDSFITPQVAATGLFVEVGHSNRRAGMDSCASPASCSAAQSFS